MTISLIYIKTSVRRYEQLYANNCNSINEIDPLKDTNIKNGGRSTEVANNNLQGKP